MTFYFFFLSAISETSIHFFGAPKLQSNSSTAVPITCVPCTITLCPPPVTGDTVRIVTND